LPATGNPGLDFEAFTRHLKTLVKNPEDVATALAPPDQALQTRTTEFLRLVPTERWLRRSITPIESAGEWLYLVVWRDVTAERELIAEREREVSTDELTGIPNRRAAQARARQARSESDLVCVALFDIDHFKRVNDAHGHPAGDEVLRRVAAELARQAGNAELVARWGGEEFIAILPGDLAAATAFCERARQAIAGLVLRGIGSVTISAGVSLLGEHFDQALERADGALYTAKALGRDRVVTD
jgi:diguanylate cyclase (GGDEF)-like protein